MSGHDLIEMADRLPAGTHMERKRLRETPMDKTTPRPWRSKPCPCGHASCPDGIVEPFVVHGQGSAKLADTALIVAAVNAYDAHRRLARTVRAYLDDWEPNLETDELRAALAAVDAVEKS